MDVTVVFKDGSDMTFHNCRDYEWKPNMQLLVITHETQRSFVNIDEVRMAFTKDAVISRGNQ